MDLDQFERLLNASRESEHLEFKEAKNHFSFDDQKKSLCGYYIAMANEKGGKLILGVTNKIPREAVGTNAFGDINKVKERIYNKFHRTIEIEELFYKKKRILIFIIPPRPIGEPLEFNGQFLKRSGESLISMSPKAHKKIIDEAVKDYSSEICEDANYKDLDTEKIRILRLLLKQSRKTEKNIKDYSDKQLLNDLGLIRGEEITNASLILLGKKMSLKKFFPHAEIRFQYKEDKNKVRSDSSVIFQGGYLGYY